MPKLLSVNVGLPREIEWEGRRVLTGIFKFPAQSRVVARRLNLDGDGQGDTAGHGGEHRAVMVYQREAYRYWEKVLGRSNFEYGQFGENFTVEGLGDDEVCIGDRYRIGSAVFEVTQPRVTCYRVGIRLDNPQMAALLVAHHKPGFYFRVITEGEVGAGDEIQKIAEGAGRVTVAEIDSLLYLPNHDLQRIAVAVDIPALSQGWKSSLEALRSARKNGDAHGNAGLVASIPSPSAWIGFRKLRVREVRHETEQVTSIVLHSPDGTSLPPALPGQHLVVRLSLTDKSPPLVRSYSISGAANEGNYRISVKRQNGAGSRYISEATRIGDLIETSAPRGDFVLRPDAGPVVLLSAGIGVTPVLSMLYTLAENEAARQVWWIHATRNGKEHVFAEEARRLLGRILNSRSIIAYSQPDGSDQPGVDFDLRGHLNLAALQDLGLPSNAQFYLCGPDGFLRDLRHDLVSLNVAADAIHEEVFGSTGSIEPGVVRTETKPPHLPDGPSASGPLVSFTRSGLAVPWDTRFKSLLELAEACDVPVKWSCRTGVCHMCETGLLEGQLEYFPEPLDEPARGNALICCSTPGSAIDLDL